MTTININEVVENFKKELGEMLESNQFEVKNSDDEMFKGIIAVKDDVGYFFEFFDQGGGDAVKDMNDDTRKPIIRLEVSTFATFPHMNLNQRIILMERLADRIGIMLYKMEGDDYCLKTSSVFFDSMHMFVAATSALSYINDAQAIIFNFLRTAMKKK